jgi:hypothetical protein
VLIDWPSPALSEGLQLACLSLQNGVVVAATLRLRHGHHQLQKSYRWLPKCEAIVQLPLPYAPAGHSSAAKPLYATQMHRNFC